MRRLWAPWRMEYVKGIESATGCFLCDAAKGKDDRGTLVAARDEHVLCILNRFPYSNGHVMLAPVLHKGRFQDLTEPEMVATLSMAQRVCTILEEAFGAHGFNLGWNLGTASGAGVKDHLHLHVVPRWKEDTNFMPVLGETKVINEALEATWETLRARFDGTA